LELDVDICMILLQLPYHIQPISPHMADRDARRFRILMRDLGKLLAAFLIQFRNAQADRLPFGVWRQPEIGSADALFDRMHQRAIPYLHRQQPRFRDGHGRHLIERHVTAIGLDLDMIDQPRRRAPRAQTAELLLEDRDRALHPPLEIVEIMRRCCHGFPPNGCSICSIAHEQPLCHPTNVARPLPPKTAVMAPGSRIENTMIGIRFSRASAKAAASMTFSSRRIASSWVRRSYRSAFGSSFGSAL